MVDYYDAVLGLIPVSFLGLGGLLSGAGFPVTTAAPIASLIAAVLVFHALFVRGPDEARAEPTPDAPVKTPAEAPSDVSRGSSTD